MTLSPRLALLAAFAAVLACAPLKPAKAYMVYDFSSTWHLNDAYRRNMEDNRKRYEDLTRNDRKRSSSSSSRRSTGSTSSARNTSTRPATPNAHRYTSSAQVTREINQQMIQSLRSQMRRNGSLNATAEQGLASLENAGLVGQMRQALRQDGYEPDSVATAMALWIVVNYAISRQMDTETLRGLRAHGLVRQLQESLAGDSDMAGKSAAEKQRMAEMLYWIGSLRLAMYHNAQQQGDRQGVASLVADARTSLSETGVQNHIRRDGNRLEIGV